MYLDSKGIIHKNYCVDMLAETTVSTLTKMNRAWNAHQVRTPIAPNTIQGEGPRINLRSNAYLLFGQKVGCSRLPFGVWETGACFREVSGILAEDQLFAFTGLYPRDTQVDYSAELLDPIGELVCYLAGCEEWEWDEEGHISVIPFVEDDEPVRIGHVKTYDDFDDNNFVLEVQINLTEIITLWEEI